MRERMGWIHFLKATLVNGLRLLPDSFLQLCLAHSLLLVFVGSITVLRHVGDEMLPIDEFTLLYFEFG